MTPTRLAIAGAAGRMGRALLRLAAEDPRVRVVAALTEAADPLLGRDAGMVAGLEPNGVALAEECTGECDVLVEFTSPSGTRAWAGWCASRGVALVSGTTGLDPPEHDALREAAKRVAVLWSANMSLGVCVLARLVREAARTLGPEWDVEIAETHHNRKADAPSGTAKMLLERVCAARGVDPRTAAVFGRCGPQARRREGEIAVHALRLGGVVGSHDVHFGGAGEVLTLSHRALSRDVFAGGALRAARWLAGKPAGMYSLDDVVVPAAGRRAAETPHGDAGG